MGYYINHTGKRPIGPKNKAQAIITDCGAKKLDSEPQYPTDENKAIICVVDNGPFEAAAFAFSPQELEAFSGDDGRPRTWLEMDRKLAEQITGYQH